MIALILIGSFQSAMLLALLLAKRQKNLSDYCLAGHFVASAISIILAYLEISIRNNGYPFPWAIAISVPSILLIGPTLWLYIKSITTERFRLKGIYALLLLPFFFVVFLLSLSYYIYPHEARIMMEQTGSVTAHWVFLVIVAMIGLSNIGYPLWGLFMVKSYRNKLKSYFSETGQIDLSWLRFLLLSSLLAYAAISGMYAYNAAFQTIAYDTLQVSGYSVASLFVLVMGFFGIRHGNVFANIQVSSDMEKALQQPGDPILPANNKEEAFIRQLLAYMKESKPYLDPGLTLGKLSAQMDTTPEFLSGIINGSLYLNFYDFVNHYRTEEFKRLCGNPKNSGYTLISMAFESGFNSKATFNRVFKKEVGLTPSEYFRKVSAS
ncbi:MAG: AraC family transcriptional regulator [Bacteroidales bacterium]